jgi:hypothetical protein
MANDQTEMTRTEAVAQVASLLIAMLTAFAILLHGLNIAKPPAASQVPVGQVSQTIVKR